MSSSKSFLRTDRPISSRLLSGGLWALFSKFGIVFVGLAGNALIARLLSPKEVGAYFLSFSIVAAGAMVAQLGLKNAAVRTIAESISIGDHGRANAAIRAVFIFGALGALIVSVFLYVGGGRWIVADLFNSELILGVLIIIPVWIVLTSAQGLLAEIFRGLHDIRLATLFNEFIQKILFLGLLVFLWIIFQEIAFNGVVMLATVSTAVSVLTAIFILNAKLQRLPGSGFDHQSVSKDVIGIALPMFFTSVTFFLMTQADIWIIGLYRQEQEIALYGAASRLVNTISIPLNIVNAIVPPFIVELHILGKKRELEKVLQTTATIAGIPAFLVLMMFIFFGDTILRIVYGSYYINGYIVLALLSLGKIINVWAGSCGLLLNLTGRHRMVMFFTIGATIYAVLSSRLVIDSYGIAGVAACFSSALIFLNISMAIYAVKSIKLKPYMTFSLDWKDIVRKVKHVNHL